MRVSIAFPLLFFSFPIFLFSQDTAVPLEISIKVTRQYAVNHSKKYYNAIYRREDLVITKDSVAEERFDVDISLKNISSDTIFIWLMSCSWEDNFLVNNNYIFMHGRDCDKNIPSLVKINVGEIKLYHTTLIRSIKFDYPCKYCVYGPQVETTKVGLIVISDITKRDYVDYDLKHGGQKQVENNLE